MPTVGFGWKNLGNNKFQSKSGKNQFFTFFRFPHRFCPLAGEGVLTTKNMKATKEGTFMAFFALFVLFVVRRIRSRPFFPVVRHNLHMLRY